PAEKTVPMTNRAHVTSLILAGLIGGLLVVAILIVLLLVAGIQGFALCPPAPQGTVTPNGTPASKLTREAASTRVPLTVILPTEEPTRARASATRPRVTATPTRWPTSVPSPVPSPSVSPSVSPPTPRVTPYPTADPASVPTVYDESGQVQTLAWLAARFPGARYIPDPFFRVVYRLIEIRVKPGYAAVTVHTQRPDGVPETPAIGLAWRDKWSWLNNPPGPTSTDAFLMRYQDHVNLLQVPDPTGQTTFMLGDNRHDDSWLWILSTEAGSDCLANIGWPPDGQGQLILTFRLNSNPYQGARDTWSEISKETVPSLRGSP
ncbi:MAG: hypothetical protein V2A79_19960, partial [Planctomycetota bacterium]